LKLLYYFYINKYFYDIKKGCYKVRYVNVFRNKSYYFFPGQLRRLVVLWRLRRRLRRRLVIRILDKRIIGKRIIGKRMRKLAVVEGVVEGVVVVVVGGSVITLKAAAVGLKSVQESMMV